MVTLKQVQISNVKFSEVDTSQVALFVGATSGIGEGTLWNYVDKARAPKVYIVGRSKAAAADQLEELAKLNPDASLNFIESEISLIRNVDTICEEIKSKESKLDLLFMSPGYLSFEGRKESSEGIDIPHALRYYSRLRFAFNLLPILNASSNPRVISILAGGKEAELDFEDLEMKNNFNVFKAAANGATQTSLAFEELAKTNPNVTFIHKFPGLVSTGVIERMLGTASGIFSYPAILARYTLIPILNLFVATPRTAGARGLFIATSARYVPAEPKTTVVGVPLPDGVEVAKSSIVTDGKGNGVYLLNEVDESAPDAPVMPGYRAEGASQKVWEDTQKVWARALASSTV